MERFASPGGLNKNDLLFQQLYTSIRDGKLPHGTRLASENELGCVVNRFVLYYANVKKGYRENGECIRTT